MKRKILVTLIVIAAISIGFAGYWFGHWWNHWAVWSEPEWWHEPLVASGYVLGCVIPLVLVCLAPAFMLLVLDSKRGGD